MTTLARKGSFDLQANRVLRVIDRTSTLASRKPLGSNNCEQNLRLRGCLLNGCHEVTAGADRREVNPNRYIKHIPQCFVNPYR